jgi:hypothetical protein
MQLTERHPSSRTQLFLWQRDSPSNFYFEMQDSVVSACLLMV